jgi:dihydrofolate synthase/folylpolyglutamate synthase
MTNAVWPARMQRLRKGTLAEAAPGAELWLDGGHNPHAARAIAEHCAACRNAPPT